MPEINGEPSLGARGRVGTFPTTHWSMVLQAGASPDSQALASLESLCRCYWYPLYAFVRRQGRDHHETEDCVQGFLAQLLAADGLQRARPERGRFRTFLLSALRNFLTTEWRRTQTAKRGGGTAPVSLAVADADRQFSTEPRDLALTPDQVFDRTWARGIIDRAVGELRAEYRRGGREPVFDALAPLIWGAVYSDSFDQAATRLKMTVPAFTVALHRARRRLGDRLRALVAETVADPTEIDAELRHLIAAISESSPRG